MFDSLKRIIFYTFLYHEENFRGFIKKKVRIAISGSHSLGKSTIVNDWVAKFPQYKREEEPYRALSLDGPYEILFRDESTKLHNGIQLYYNIGRVNQYARSNSDVIFDRSPVDYIAYSQYTANQNSTDIDSAFVESMVPAVKESLEHLDILAFVPKSDQWPVEMEDDGIRPVDTNYRDDVDTIFILGPSHHVRLAGCALTQTSEYETPLYNLIIDEESKYILPLE